VYVLKFIWVKHELKRKESFISNKILISKKNKKMLRNGAFLTN